MRPLAMLAFSSVSIAIIVSYSLIPNSFAKTFTNAYHQYWILLTILFFIAVILMFIAFYFERKSAIGSWLHHFVILSLMTVFISETCALIKIVENFFIV